MTKCEHTNTKAGIWVCPDTLDAEEITIKCIDCGEIIEEERIEQKQSWVKEFAIGAVVMVVLGFLTGVFLRVTGA